MYQKILVPYAMDEDHDPKVALGIAQRLAKDGAEIVLCHVMEHVPRYAVQYVSRDDLAVLRAGLVEELDRLAADVPGGRGHLVEGHGGRTIVKEAAEMGADLIVIHSHRPEMADLVLGSTAAHVVRQAEISVHVIR